MTVTCSLCKDYAQEVDTNDKGASLVLLIAHFGKFHREEYDQMRGDPNTPEAIRKIIDLLEAERRPVA